MNELSIERWAAICVCAALSMASACYGADGTKVADTNTNWLRACEVEGDCGGGLSCISGLCTLPCQGDAMCEALADEGQCVEVPGHGSACDLSCESDSSCRALDRALSCLAGYCREDGAADASIPERSCDPGADDVRPSWRRVEAGLEDFVVKVDRTPPLEPAEPNTAVGASGLAGVAFGNGTFVVVGGGDVGAAEIRVATSSNAVAWEPAIITSMHGEVGGVSRVFFAHDTFAFIATHEPRMTTPQPVLYTSTDGRTWSARALPSSMSTAHELASDGEHVQLAAGNLWTSTDLIRWTETTFDTGNPRAGIASVAFGDGRWVAAGLRSSSEGGVYRGVSLAFSSTDGIAWTPIGLPGTDNFDLAYGDGLWIATNNVGEYRTSRDSIDFVVAEPTGAWSTIHRFDHRVHYAGGRFLRAVVDSEQVPPPEVQIIGTQDGLAWESFGSVPGLSLPEGAVTVEYTIHDVAYDDCRYVIAGVYTMTEPIVFDPPAGWSEKGPFLMTADLAQP